MKKQRSPRVGLGRSKREFRKYLNKHGHDFKVAKVTIPYYNLDCFHTDGKPRKIFLSRKDAWEEIERSCVNQDVEPYICPNCTCIHIGTRKED